MLARRLTTILPAMTLAEAMETMRHPGTMGVGNGNGDYPIRGEYHKNIISRCVFDLARLAALSVRLTKG